MKTLKFDLDEGTRLDKVATEALGISRTAVQKAIKAGLILVDGKNAYPRTVVENKNKVEYEESITIPRVKTDFPAPKLDIIYEDDDVIVVNKPAGLIVHETDTSDEPTLVQGLIAHHAAIAKVGDKIERAGLVHRLDKATSGIIIAAKTQEAFEFLKDQFKQRKTKKYYTALVRGQMEKPVGTIDLLIERSKSTGRMAARPTSQKGKEAITHYEVIKTFPHHTLLDVQIETGRTHQIRAHMYAIEHPVVGDTLYRQKGVKPRDIGRLFLHARELSIMLPMGKKKTFKAPLPKDLEEVLEDIPKI